MMDAHTRIRVVNEAMSWLRTPYVDCGDIKGPNGAVDCAMLLVRVFADLGLIPKDYDPRPYKPDWHIHNNEELYMAGLEQFCNPVSTPQIGDVAMFKFGRHASHGGIIVSETLLVHANKEAKQVELMERRRYDTRLNSYWSLK
jgi:cell wall-associated NlpC family hydrolase